jgi:arginyl-tRNA synthetase
MPTITSQLDTAFRLAITSAFGREADPLIAQSQNENFGDYQSNAAMGLAKVIAEMTGSKSNPRAIAEQIKAKLDLGEMAAEVSIAGPGFINVKLSPAWVTKQLTQVAGDMRLGIETVAEPQTVVVDYSGPNIAKEMHVGHLRSTIIGDCIARVLAEQGHNVIRQNHIGDWGTQFGKVVFAVWYAVMAESYGLAKVLEQQIAACFRPDWAKDTVAQERLLGEIAGFDQRFVRDDPKDALYLRKLEQSHLSLTRLEQLYRFISSATDTEAAGRFYVFSEKRQEWLSLAAIPRMVTTFIQNPGKEENVPEKRTWEIATETTLETSRLIYRQLGVLLEQGDERGESTYREDLAAIVNELRERGVATDSEGAVVVFLRGYSTPLMVQKSDGGYLYGTTDLAAIKYRARTLGADRIIYTHDSRQAQHFAQVFATAHQAGWAEAVSLEYAPFGTMLGEDGKPFRTRSGGTVKLQDLLDESEQRALAVVVQRNPDLTVERQKTVAHAVGIGGVKYSDLSKDRTSDYMFSFDKMLALEGNTAPYLQYAHARIRSIFRKALEQGAKPGELRLESPFELALAKHVLRLADAISLVARELKPHHLCSYLYELATKFSGFYENCPVLKSEEAVRASRLALCDVAGRTLALGLELLGIEHPEEM